MVNPAMATNNKAMRTDRLLTPSIVDGPKGQRGSTAKQRSESGEGRIRTGDTTIFSRVLYQLSYLASAREPLAQRQG
jgi:hypothetical protein